MSGEAGSLNGPLLLAKAKSRLEELESGRKAAQSRLEELNFPEIESGCQTASNERAKQEQRISSLERGMRKLEKRIAEREAERINLQQRENETQRGLPPGICGAHKDEVRGECRFFKNAPQAIGAAQTAADIASQRNLFQEQMDDDRAELEIARQDLPALQTAETDAQAARNQASREREKIVAELAGYEAQIEAASHSLKHAQVAEERREINKNELRDLAVGIRRSKDIQNSIRSSALHRSLRLNFSHVYQQVFRRLADEDATASVRYDSDGLLQLEAKTEEAITGSAVDALKVICFDLAVMLWSSAGYGHHPRFLIHDSPRVADLSPLPYGSIFELVNEVEAELSGRVNFQYIISTTEPPPENLNGDQVILRLDASLADGKLFKRSF